MADMFEGQERCALCNRGVSHGDCAKRVDLNGFTHAFCVSCAGKSGEVEKRLSLGH